MELRLLSSCLSFLSFRSEETDAGSKDEKSSYDYPIERLEQEGDGQLEEDEEDEEEEEDYKVEEEEEEKEVDKANSLWWPDPSSIIRMASNTGTLRRLLQDLDDGGGRIHLSRLLRLMPGPDPAAPAHELNGWYKNGMSAVAIEEVVKIATARRGLVQCVASLMSAFEFYDRDGDGVISAADLRKALRDVVRAREGVRVLKEEEEEEEEDVRAGWVARCEAMVRKFDRKRVGGVCFDDFVRMMLNS